ncbi:hypothetical protein F9C07_2236928 [Aspergillus flavus]|uniref:Uncharacterized protein n=1 Tax=Aspergillus flavus (strain ATCC 200026 / FGSC A1120 / IAM 13836 / NRRL 3357 / JCM 12722 / SRRC 167) TaxID=332952 RepID=A0A7U2R333_ASPFN|nr:hypothetical protein F9C07_2236928 [Aspergillus flavus]
MSFKVQVPGQQEGLLRGLSGSIGQASFTKKELDINQTVEKYSSPDQNILKFKKGLNISAPQPGSSGGRQGESRMGNKFKHAQGWVNDYLDRKEVQHPGIALAVTSDKRKPLKLPYNDHNHPVISGSLILLLTRGHVPVPGIDKMLYMTLEQSGIKRLVRGHPSGHPLNVGLPQGSIERVIDKKIHEDVLYLLVVNLSCKKEVQESVNQLERLMKKKGVNADSHYIVAGGQFH